MRTAEEMELQEAGEAILRALRGNRFGSIEVLDGSVDVRPNTEGDEAAFVTLELSAASQEEGSPWPRSDLRALRAAFRGMADKLNPRGRTYVWMESHDAGSIDERS